MKKKSIQIYCDKCSKIISNYESFISIKKSYYDDNTNERNKEIKQYCNNCSKLILKYDIFNFKW